MVAVFGAQTRSEAHLLSSELAGCATRPVSALRLLRQRPTRQPCFTSHVLQASMCSTGFSQVFSLGVKLPFTSFRSVEWLENQGQHVICAHSWQSNM